MIKTPTSRDSITLSLTAMASGAIWFYTGPMAAIAARDSFEIGYDFLYGIPHWYNPSYALTYLPLREHVTHYGYEYGGLVLGSLCAPFIYKSITITSNLGEKLLTNLGVFSSDKPENQDEKITEQEVNNTPMPILQFSKQKNPKTLTMFDIPLSEKKHPNKFSLEYNNRRFSN